MLKEIIVGTSILALGPFALSGCSTNPPKVAIQVKPAVRVPLNLPSTDTINQREVKWIIVTPENVDDVFHKLSKESVDGAIFGLTDTGYENLSLNMAAIRKLVQQQQAIIIAYEEYYKDQDNALIEHNKQFK
jgi:hypothetical protein